MSKRIFGVLCCLVLLGSSAVALSADTWKCEACGQTGNTAKFCTNCGQPKPLDNPWDCSGCGRTGNTDNYCGNCGRPRPVIATEIPKATNTPKPTNTPTPKPTNTPKLTNTPTPKPTSTPKPTNTPKPTATPTPKTTLSPENKCPVQPTIYCNPRQWSRSSDIASDLKALSAKNIKKYQGTLDYGLYFKFTPKAKDDGYVIKRFDVIITGPDGTVEYENGFFDFMECKKNYYWYWKFFSLQDMFDKHIRQYGDVKTGTYRMDIYFNELWAGKTSFRVEK